MHHLLPAYAGPSVPTFQPASAPVMSSILGQTPNQVRVPDWPTSLSELIHDCFQKSVDSSNMSADRLEYVHCFHKYLADCHSHENLAFLIEIYRYEYFYDRISLHAAPSGCAEDGNVVSIGQVDAYSQHFIGKLPYPTAAMGRHLRKASIKTHSNSSLASGSTGAPFELEIEDSIVVSGSTDPLEAWNLLSEQQLAQDSDTDSECGNGSDSGADSGPDSGPDSVSPATSGPDCDSLLADQWHFIIATYIEAHGPCQINLSNKVSRALLECDNDTSLGAHSPGVLADAKTEVIRLIHENTYHSFTKKMLSRTVCTESSCGFSSSGSTSHSRADSPLSTSSHTKKAMKSEEVLENAKVIREVATPVAPVPQKRRSKFLSPFASATGSANTSESGSNISGSTPLSNMFTHFKSSPGRSPTLSRSYSSAPHSPANASTPTRGSSPFSNLSTEDIIPRPRSSMAPEGHQSTSILGKLWRKKK